MPTLDRAELEDMRLYLDLAWRLGMLHAQMDRGTLKNARLTYRGEVAAKNTKLITASFAAGLMESALEEQVNLVNAMPLARDRGIAIEERSAEAPGDFGTLIQAEVTTDRKTYVAAGTLFGKQFLRLVRLGSYPLDAHFDGTLLVFTHHGPPRPDRFHRQDAWRRGRQHRPDERRPASSKEARPSASSTSTASPRRRPSKPSRPIRMS